MTNDSIPSLPVGPDTRHPQKSWGGPVFRDTQDWVNSVAAHDHQHGLEDPDDPEDHKETLNVNKDTKLGTLLDIEEDFYLDEEFNEDDDTVGGSDLSGPTIVEDFHSHLDGVVKTFCANVSYRKVDSVKGLEKPIQTELHMTRPNADQRRLYIHNITPVAATTLIRTSTLHEAIAVRDLLYHHISRGNSLRVCIPTPISSRFTFHLSLPSYTIIKNHRIPDTRQLGSRPLRKTIEIPALGTFIEGQTTIVLTGADDMHWTAIALVDNPHVDLDSSPSRLKSPTIKKGILNTEQNNHTNSHLPPARAYFLQVWAWRMAQITRSWEEIVESVSKSAQNLCLEQSSVLFGSRASSTIQTVAGLESFVRTRTHLWDFSMQLKMHLNNTIRTWEQFQMGDINYFTDFMDPNSQRLSERSLVGLKTTFETLQELNTTLETDIAILKDTVSSHPLHTVVEETREEQLSLELAVEANKLAARAHESARRINLTTMTLLPFMLTFTFLSMDSAIVPLQELSWLVLSVSLGFFAILTAVVFNLDELLRILRQGGGRLRLVFSSKQEEPRQITKQPRQQPETQVRTSSTDDEGRPSFKNDSSPTTLSASKILFQQFLNTAWATIIGFSIAARVRAAWKTKVSNKPSLRTRGQKGECGKIHVSWKCRCGKRIGLDVAEDCQGAAKRFAQEAAGSAASIRFSESAFTTGQLSTASLSSDQTESAPRISSDDWVASISPSTAPTSVNPSQEPTHVPGTKRYLLFCVKSGPNLIKMRNIDLTYIGQDQVLFQELRKAHREMRGWLMWNPFIIAQTVEYVKFDLITRQRSGQCVGTMQPGSIPPPKQVFAGEYAYWPCPPEVGPYPVDAETFMHSFQTPGDHSDELFIKRLPKKMHCPLDTSGSPGESAPVGWGIYIVEGPNLYLVRLMIGFSMFGIVCVGFAWSAVARDVQSGGSVVSAFTGVVGVGVAAALLAP